VWVCYLVLLAPTAGLVQFGPQMAADRFTYVSCLGWALLGGGGCLWGWRAWRNGELGFKVSCAIAVVTIGILTGLGVLTVRQLRVWHDSETLWSHALAVDSTSALALYGFGRILVEKGQLAEATAYFQQALQRKPDFAEAYNNAGSVLARQGK